MSKCCRQTILWFTISLNIVILSIYQSHFFFEMYPQIFTLSPHQRDWSPFILSVNPFSPLSRTRSVRKKRRDAYCVRSPCVHTPHLRASTRPKLSEEEERKNEERVVLPGLNKVKINFEQDVPSGIYYLILRDSKKINKRKMMLVRW